MEVENMTTNATSAIEDRPCFSCGLQPWQFHVANALFIAFMLAPSHTRFGQVRSNTG